MNETIPSLELGEKSYGNTLPLRIFNQIKDILENQKIPLSAREKQAFCKHRYNITSKDLKVVDSFFTKQYKNLDGFFTHDGSDLMDMDIEDFNFLLLGNCKQNKEEAKKNLVELLSIKEDNKLEAKKIQHQERLKNFKLVKRIKKNLSSHVQENKLGVIINGLDNIQKLSDLIELLISSGDIKKLHNLMDRMDRSIDLTNIIDASDSIKLAELVRQTDSKKLTELISRINRVEDFSKLLDNVNITKLTYIINQADSMDGAYIQKLSILVDQVVPEKLVDLINNTNALVLSNFINGSQVGKFRELIRSTESIPRLTALINSMKEQIRKLAEFLKRENYKLLTTLINQVSNTKNLSNYIKTHTLQQISSDLEYEDDKENIIFSLENGPFSE